MPVFDRGLPAPFVGAEAGVLHDTGACNDTLYNGSHVARAVLRSVGGTRGVTLTVVYAQAWHTVGTEAHDQRLNDPTAQRPFSQTNLEDHATGRIVGHVVHPFAHVHEALCAAERAYSERGAT